MPAFQWTRLRMDRMTTRREIGTAERMYHATGDAGSANADGTTYEKRTRKTIVTTRPSAVAKRTMRNVPAAPRRNSSVKTSRKIPKPLVNESTYASDRPRSPIPRYASPAVITRIANGFDRIRVPAPGGASIPLPPTARDVSRGHKYVTLAREPGDVNPASGASAATAAEGAAAPAGAPAGGGGAGEGSEA